jgi:hypothetical protein
LTGDGRRILREMPDTGKQRLFVVVGAMRVGRDIASTGELVFLEPDKRRLGRTGRPWYGASVNKKRSQRRKLPVPRVPRLPEDNGRTGPARRGGRCGFRIESVIGDRRILREMPDTGNQRLCVVDCDLGGIAEPGDLVWANGGGVLAGAPG